MTGRRRWKPYTGIARRYDYLGSAVLEMARGVFRNRVPHPSLVRLHGLARDPDSGSTPSPWVPRAVAAPRPPRPRGPHRPALPGGQRAPHDGAAAVGRGGLRKNLIIHRDIRKPDNILVAVDGAVKIGDYGSALSIAGQNDDDAYWAAGTRRAARRRCCWRSRATTRWSTRGPSAASWRSSSPGGAVQEHCDSDQLHRIYDVFGVPGKREWKPYESSFVADKVPVWRREQAQQRRRGRWHSNRLRELVPEKLLSKEGFEVLKGLLACNPNKRLAAAAAIKLPWFADNDHAPVELQVTVGH
ncbi:hypothetical protein ZWY2020_010535 [Hordeum vulgare]|nr:hypothetical protein ZWY2020_010535 [Hordeum vulgare]